MSLTEKVRKGIKNRGSMKKKIKTINFEIKEPNEEDRSFLAVASTGDIDRDNDRIMATGWDLENFKKNPVVPWSHHYGEPPIAKVKEIYVEGDKLMFRPQFATKEEYEFADTIYKLYKGGFLGAFSVGFMPKRAEIVDRGKGMKGYDFLEVELWEISACTVPSNPDALISAVAKGVISEDERRQAEAVLTKDEALESVLETLNEIKKTLSALMAEIHKPEPVPVIKVPAIIPETPALDKSQTTEIVEAALEAAMAKIGKIVEKRINYHLGIVE